MRYSLRNGAYQDAKFGFGGFFGIAGWENWLRWGPTIYSVWSSSSIHFVSGGENSLRWGLEQIVC